MPDLRAVRDALERLPLDDAAEAPVLLQPGLDELRRWAERAGLTS
jgi:hypothetical protein